MRNTLKLERISFGYLDKKDSSVNPVLDNFELTLKEGEIGIVLGPSGGGKTTILRAIAGFLDPSLGRINIDGCDVFNSQNKSGYIPSEQRNVGMVFQDFALFPHLNVRENIIFALTKGKLRSVTDENLNRVDEMLSLTGMTHFAETSIQNLSGGQKQRVALARALAPSPKLILFDEPFSNLDPALRQVLVKEVREMLKATSTTALFAAAVPFVIPSSFSMSASLRSAEPMMNEVPAVIAPVAVTLRKPEVSLLESTVTALEAATVPAVRSSISSISASAN